MERYKERTNDILDHILRLTRQAHLMLDAYSDIMNQLDACQRYLELSRRHRAKLRHGLLVIEGSPSRFANSGAPMSSNATGKVISLFGSRSIPEPEKR